MKQEQKHLDQYELMVDGERITERCLILKGGMTMPAAQYSVLGKRSAVGYRKKPSDDFAVLKQVMVSSS